MISSQELRDQARFADLNPDARQALEAGYLATSDLEIATPEELRQEGDDIIDRQPWSD